MVSSPRPSEQPPPARGGAWAGAYLARCTFAPPGTTVTCAVSGGRDSLALLALAVEAGCQVTAVHVDHGLRPGSPAEADIVRDAARHVGAGFRAVSVAVAHGSNLEARARAARRSALPPDVLTGHTADDQAETVLLNLLRGSGADGIAAMAPGPGKPLLALRRAETAAVCAVLGWTPVHDPTNDDPRHRRNRVRHQLLPLLEDIAGRDPVPLLVRAAALARDDAALAAQAATALDPTDARALADAPPALARRAVRAWLTDGYPPDLASVERVLAVARGDAAACELGGGRRVERSAQRLRVIGPAPARGDGHAVV